MKTYLLAAVAAFGLASAAGAAPLMLTEGTPVIVRTMEELSSKKAQVGDPVNMEVFEDVSVGGAVVIPAGTPAYGEITAAERNGHLGKSGKLTIEVNYVKLGDRRLRVRGTRDSKGGSGSGAMVATTILVSPLGLLIHGKSANVPPHTKFTAYVVNDTPVVIDGVTPIAPAAAPIHVSATAH